MSNTVVEMYEEIEQREDVAIGYVAVLQMNAYDFDKMVPEINAFDGKPTGKMVKREKSRGPYFCQTEEQKAAFKANNPEARIETFSIQFLKRTAIAKLNDPENVKQFK